MEYKVYHKIHIYIGPNYYLVFKLLIDTIIYRQLTHKHLKQTHQLVFNVKNIVYFLSYIRLQPLK